MKTSCALFLIASFFLQSCAAIFAGGSTKVTVKQGTPAQAQVYYNGNLEGQAPATFKVGKQESNSRNKIEIAADGYHTQTVVPDRHAMAGFIVLDILCGVIPLGIDFLAGTIYKVDPQEINYQLQPVK